MNNAEALKVLQNYYDTQSPTADDEFKFTEALGYLIEETKDFYNFFKKHETEFE